jgi:hypothetical protein
MGFISGLKGLKVKERRGYSHLKEQALDRSMWRVHFGRGFGPVVRQTTKNEMNNRCMSWDIKEIIETTCTVQE